MITRRKVHKSIKSIKWWQLLLYVLGPHIKSKLSLLGQELSFLTKLSARILRAGQSTLLMFFLQSTYLKWYQISPVLILAVLNIEVEKCCSLEMLKLRNRKSKTISFRLSNSKLASSVQYPDEKLVLVHTDKFMVLDLDPEYF